ncbi:hypothetical protein ZWY2020_037992 [Hordeum vulgare]|nr:hypothetical protein ZWY2020_037992 [Hordeum vulgare]
MSVAIAAKLGPTLADHSPEPQEQPWKPKAPARSGPGLRLLIRPPAPRPRPLADPSATASLELESWLLPMLPSLWENDSARAPPPVDRCLGRAQPLPVAHPVLVPDGRVRRPPLLHGLKPMRVLNHFGV